MDSQLSLIEDTCLLMSASAEHTSSGEDERPCVPIDVEHLNQYTLGDRGLEREILTLFRDQLHLHLETLSGDCCAVTWKETTHTLKGAARGVGAWTISDLAAEAEDLDGQVEISRKQAVVSRLGDAAIEVSRFIDFRLLDSAF